MPGIGIRTVYSVTNVGTTNWVVLVSSTSDTVSQVSIFDSSGQTLELGSCAAGATANSEVRQLLIPPGGVPLQNLQIPIGSRISIRAVSSAVSSGENDLNVVY